MSTAEARHRRANPAAAAGPSGEVALPEQTAPDVRDDRKARVGGRRFPLVVTVLVTLEMTWPLVFHLGSNVAADIYDPLYHTWQLAWIGHALLHSPLSLFQSNTYWPSSDSLAFTDAMLGYAPAGLIAAIGPHAALFVHNLLFLFAYGLAFYGAYMLARELGAGTSGGLVAGAAFAYAPWRLAQNGHLHVISSGGIPLALGLLLRGYRRGSPRTILAGWLVAAWQMSLGFTLGLQLAYLFLVLAVVAAVAWFRRGRPVPGKAIVRASAVGAGVFVCVTALLALPYLRVLSDHPEARKSATAVAFYSPPPSGFLAAPAESSLWNAATAHWRNMLTAPAEQTLFPGVTILLLALLGLAASAYSRRLRFGLGAGVLLCALLSLGLPDFAHPKKGFALYRFLYDFAPGWDGVRAPGRINTLTSLGLALLAAAGAAAIMRRFPIRPLAVLGVLVAAILAEGFGPIPQPLAPAAPAGEVGLPGPRLDLPSDIYHDATYGYWSTWDYEPIVGGAGSFVPRELARTRDVTRSFPDASSVAFLRRLGVRTVILHLDLAPKTPWRATAKRPIDGLPLTRQRIGPIVVYRLRPCKAACCSKTTVCGLSKTIR